MKYGINFQNQVDICSINNGVCVLTLIQFETVDETNIELLQSKLNHYMAYMLDGQLEKEEPTKFALPKQIELNIGHKPTSILLEFISKLEPILKSEKIGFVLITE